MAGETYGNELSFVTFNVPQMSTPNVSAITTRSAWGQDRFENTGGVFPSTFGFAWNTSPTPLWNVHSSLTGVGTVSSFTRELSSLLFSTTYYVRAYGISPVGIGYSPEIEFTTRFPSTATVSTVQPFAQLSTGTGIQSGGNVTNDGGWFVGSRGTVWSLLPNPTLSSISTFRTVDGVNTERGNYTSAISSLAISSLYYIRAYTSTVAGETYGDELTFQTYNVPQMSTPNVSAITTRSAWPQDRFENTGGVFPSTYGFAWNTSPTPLWNVHSTNVGLGTVSSFTREMSSLLFSTTYYLRAYGISPVGIGYSSEISFTTPEPSTPTVSTISLVAAANARTASTGAVLPFDGGATITQRGVVWDVNPSPTVDLSTQQINALGGTNPYTATISTLSTNTLYYARAYSVNAAGVGYGQNVSTLTNDFPTLSTTEVSTLVNPLINPTSSMVTAYGYIVSTGRTAITNYGFAYGFLSTPTVLTASTIAGNGATAAYTATISTLQPGSNYYIRSFGSNAVGITYGQEIQFSSLTTVPWLSTLSSASIFSGGSSLVTASLLNTGGSEPVSRRGIIWGLTSTLAVSTTTEDIGLFSTGLFSTFATGLMSTSTYFMRAYAVNTIGFGYGNLISLSATTGGGLYTFTSLTFTNAGATGRAGPAYTAIKSEYNTAPGGGAWTQNTSYLNMTTQGIQLWTVPQSGSYQITTVGAKGGDGRLGINGRGTRMIGTFSLIRGDILKIVVGQQGLSALGPGGCGSLLGGGGGGSFVTDNSNNPLIVAGGGGGGSYYIISQSQVDATTVNNGNAGDGSPGGGTGGVAGGGGGQGTGCVTGAPGGGGLTGNGVPSGSGGGTSFTNSAQGGTLSYIDGGFGGGGSSHLYTGGGGGGYSGGGGGGLVTCSCTSLNSGGGGGSFNNGTSQSNSTGIGTAMGSVTITRL